MTKNGPDSDGLPITLLLSGHPCLVVGGGRVALRKIGMLLQADARVTVVSPEVTDEVAELAAAGHVAHVERPFETDDPAGMRLVYAATNSRTVNRQVLEACRKQGVLCCCVDGNWSEGDFTTPAIARHDRLTLSVSSGGRDCRRSKLVKNSLERHLKMMDSANLVVVGTDHNRLTVEEREPYHLTGHRLERAGFMIMQLWGIHEFMILNTCNRVEVIAVVSDETAENGILRHVMGFAPLKEDKYYLKSGYAAFEHLCLVTAGMLSQTPGENHITAQVKEALDTACRRGWANGMLQDWVSSALYVSKAIKNRVSPLQQRYEIEDLALKYLASAGRSLAEDCIMILGAGTIGSGLVRDSLPRARRIIWCYHVNRPELPGDADGRIECCTFNEMKNRLAEADVIISATDAPGHVLHAAHAPFFNQEHPVLAIDLGVPRNIDPELDTLSADVTIIDLDDLKYWYRRELADMDELLSLCRSTVAEHRHLYEKTAHSFQGRQSAE